MARDLFAPTAGLDVSEPVAGADLFARDPNAPGPFKKGLTGAGVPGLKSSLYGAGALVARSVGAEETARAALAAAAEQNAIAAENIQTLDQVDWTNPESIRKQFAYYLGAGVPSLAAMGVAALLARVTGGMSARALGANPIAIEATKRAASYAGAAVPSIALETGGTFQSALETGVDLPELRALAGGFPGGLV